MSTLPLAGRIDEIRAEFPAVARGGYYNTGTIAPLPRRVLDAHQERERRYHYGGPLDKAYSGELRGLSAAVRGKVASLLGADAGRVALAENTTAGVNAALLSQTWEAGDEIITSAAEHPAVELPLAYLHRRYGVTIRVVPVRGGVLELERLAEASGPRTRAVVLSHVSFTTGGAYDVAAVCAWARQHGVLSVIDGAQSAGAVPLDLPAMDPDFYALPGYKWTLGPQGTAALYASERVTGPDPVPYRIGSHAISEHGEDWSYALHPDARRYEGTGTTAALDIIAWGDSLDYIKSLGSDHVYRRIAGLCTQFKAGLAQLDGVELITPPEAGDSAGLVSFRLPPPLGAQEAADRLYEQGLIVRTVRGGALRASFHVYNTEEEVAGLTEAVRVLLARGQ